MITSILDPNVTSCAELEVIVGMEPSAERDTLADNLLDLECRVYLASSPEDALNKLQIHFFHIVLVAENYSLDVMQWLACMPMSARRNIFYVLVGKAFETGNYMQSFVLSANLVVNTADMGSLPQLLQNTLLEYNYFYRPFYYISQAASKKLSE